MKKIWERIARSFKEAEELDTAYYRNMSHADKLNDMQLLREIYYNINKKAKDAGRKGLQRVIRIIQQA